MPSPNLIPQRYPEMMSTERAALDQLFSSTVLAHVAGIVDGRAVAIPTAFAVFDDRLVIHGSTGSRWMRALVNAEVTITITRISGVVVARSMFESSVLYRSAMLFGTLTKVDPAETEELLERFTDRLLPGRSNETRPSNRKEVAATMLLQMPIQDWSMRISEDMPEDDTEDIASDAWAGHIRFDEIRARAHPAPDLRAGIGTPGSVERVLANTRGII